MGDRPESAPTATALRRTMGQAITDGSPPGAMAEAVLDAIAEDRFWVIPHREFLELAVQRWQRIAQGLNPEMTEQVPGMPPTRQILAEQAAEAPTTSPLQRTSATRR